MVMVNGQLSTKWFNSVSCSQRYKDIDTLNDISIEFTSGWVCPDVSEIELDNNPVVFTAGNGTSFVFVANKCDIAKQIETENKLQPFNEDECASEEVFLDNIDKLQFKSKIMAQDPIDPQKY